MRGRPRIGYQRAKRGLRYPLVLTFIALWATSAFGDDVGRPTNVDVPVETAGGEIQVRWNPTLLEALGMRIDGTPGRLGVTSSGFDRFTLRGDSSLAIVRHGQSLTGVTNGVLYVRGGYELVSGKTPIHLTDFLLVSRNDTPRQFEVQLTDSTTLFLADHVMIEPTDAGRDIAIRTMDLRVTAALAARLGKPEITGWQVATLRTQSRVTEPVSLAGEACPASGKWPGTPVAGHPGQTYQTDVFMRQFDVQFTGCRGCSGPGGHGVIKITPTTLLQNNVNNGAPSFTVPDDPRGISKVLNAADVPWRQMFSKDCAPYKNDQHPYLAWNLYRVNAVGQLDQLARSGVKHAHIAENGNCVENPGSNHVLGLGCIDAYGTGDNDVPDLLGPRSEIIPATGQWGRCGSIYDPECKGFRYGFKGYDDFAYRLLTSESALDPEANKGAEYFVEAWYVVRDDVDPYNSMATARIKTQWYAPNHLWSVANDGTSNVGPMIDRWVEPVLSNETSANTEIATDAGRVKVAVKVSPIENGRFRYDYVVMNVDYAEASTSGREPNLRIISTHGLTEFSVQTSPDAKPQKAGFSGVESERTPTWRSSISSGTVAWRAPADAELTWGTLFHFSIESNQPPKTAIVTIGASAGRTHLHQTATLLAP